MLACRCWPGVGPTAALGEGVLSHAPGVRGGRLGACRKGLGSGSGSGRGRPAAGLGFPPARALQGCLGGPLAGGCGPGPRYRCPPGFAERVALFSAAVSGRGLSATPVSGGVPVHQHPWGGRGRGGCEGCLEGQGRLEFASGHRGADRALLPVPRPAAGRSSGAQAWGCGVGGLCELPQLRRCVGRCVCRGRASLSGSAAVSGSPRPWLCSCLACWWCVYW